MDDVTLAFEMFTRRNYSQIIQYRDKREISSENCVLRYFAAGILAAGLIMFSTGAD